MGTENASPYVTLNFNKKPSWTAYATSGLYKIKSYEELHSIDDVKDPQFQCKPVNFGMRITEGLYTTIDVYKPSGKVVGGHSMVICGWDDMKQAFYVRNSWGVNWGMYGYFWLPYKIFEQEAWDKWIVRLK